MATLRDSHLYKTTGPPVPGLSGDRSHSLRGVATFCLLTTVYFINNSLKNYLTKALEAIIRNGHTSVLAICPFQGHVAPDGCVSLLVYKEAIKK